MSVASLLSKENIYQIFCCVVFFHDFVFAWMFEIVHRLANNITFYLKTMN